MSDIIQLQEKYYVLASSSLADRQTRVLKEGDTFAVFNRYGDVQQLGLTQNGIYHQGTRFISQLELKLGHHRPLLLSSAIDDTNCLVVVDLTNADITQGQELLVPRGSVHIRRLGLLWQSIYYETIVLENLGTDQLEIALSLLWDADFVDIFEVRGYRRERRGEKLASEITDHIAVMSYRGLDDVTRTVHIELNPPPERMQENGGEFSLWLPPKKKTSILLDIAFQVGDERPKRIGFERARYSSQADFVRVQEEGCRIISSNEQFNAWVRSSAADVLMLTTETEHGDYPYAGIPWYSTVFGRDGIITALEMLWLEPDLARGVLKYLAETQASEIDEMRDAEPGKIVHEMRGGEMAALGEIPFGRYYGTVDATPLFVVLAGEFYRRTADLEYVETLWPNVVRALDWIDVYGDVDRDGFVEYARKTDVGLVNQGWKDSDNSVFHEDGSMPPAPIALCEVQGYVYQAKLEAAELAAALNKHELARELQEQAKELRRKFDQAFWVEEHGFYAGALDGKKKRCRILTSNAGHALFSGIAAPSRSQALALKLMEEHFFSGWGIRTVSTREKLYSPVSYHNGTIWPHDNAMIAAGLAAYGFKDAALKILQAIFEVSLHAEARRLPELFCGFPREHGVGPTFYPVACAPQAWAAGAVFLLLQASLGIHIDGPKKLVEIRQPSLPGILPVLHIQNLRVGSAVLDLTCQQYQGDVSVSVSRRVGEVTVVVTK